MEELQMKKNKMCLFFCFTSFFFIYRWVFKNTCVSKFAPYDDVLMMVFSLHMNVPIKDLYRVNTCLNMLGSNLLELRSIFQHYSQSVYCATVSWK